MTNQLIETLEEARATSVNAEGAMTMDDLMHATGRSKATLRLELWELKRAGRLGVTRVKKQRIDGVWTGTVAYSLKAAEAEE